MKTTLILVLILLCSSALAQQPLGTLRTNQFDTSSVSNPFGAGSPFKSNGLLNPFSRYGSPHSPYSWSNPFATSAPRLYQGGKYRGRLSTNRFDLDSTSNPFGRYGSPFSPESINNPFGAGSPFATKPIQVWPGD